MRRRRDDEFMEEEAEFRRALDAVPPPTPPDGGWGWVVVLSSFFMNMVVDGVCYSYGILLPDLVSHYGTSTAMISLGGALLLGSYMMSGILYVTYHNVSLSWCSQLVHPIIHIKEAPDQDVRIV